MSAVRPQKEYGEPIGDRVLVRPMEKTSRKGAIFIPENAQEKSSMGIVVAVGTGHYTPERELVPLLLEVGDIVLFGKYSGSEVEIHSETLTIMREDEVLLRLPKGTV